MSIIYSYPTSQPTVDDLLIGTDVNDENATKSFTVQSLVSLINAANGSGTVTSVQIATDAFLSATGGPITDAGVITMGLTATGTPSTTTFLRGDNQWVTPTISAGISIFNESILLTNDVSSINFVGNGVSSSSDALGNTTVNILGATSTVDSVDAGTGISVNQTTGDIVVTNTGVTSIIAGTNVTLTGTGTGQVTINSTGSGASGGVTIIQPGSGLVLEAGSTTSDPTIGIDYIGADTYITHAPPGDPAPSDTFAFQKGTSEVKEGTFSTIPVTALTLVNTAITESVADVVKYDTPAPTAANLSPFTFPSLPNVRNVVTLTDLEYTNLTTKDGNTLYLTATTGVTQYTKTLAIDSSSITGTQYVLTGDQVGATQTGASGSNYAFSTGISLTSGYQWASGAPTISNAQGVFSSTGAVTTNLGTGTIQAIPAGSGTATVTIVDSLTKENGAVNGTNYQIVAGTNPLTGTAPFTYTSSNFGVAASVIGLAAEWEIVSPVYTYSPTSGTVASGQTAPVTCTVTGTVRKKTYTLTYNITDSNTGGTINTDYTISNSTTGQPFTGGTAPLAQTMTAVYNTAYNFSTNYTNVSGAGTSTTVNSRTLANPITGNITANVTLSNTIVSTTGSTSGTAALTTTNQIVSPDGTGTGTGYTAQAQYSIGSGSTNWQNYDGTTVTGSTGTVVNFQYVFSSTALTGYTYQVAPTFSAITTITINSSPQTVTTTLTGTVIDALTQVVNATPMRGSASLACGIYTGSAIYYFNGSGTYPAQYDNIYSDQQGLSPLANGFYAMYYGSAIGSTINVTGGAGSISQAPASCPTTGTATLTTINTITSPDGTGTNTGYTATPQYKIGSGAWINGSTITANIGQVISFQYTFNISPGYVEQAALGFSAINTITITSSPQTTSTTLSGAVIEQLTIIEQGTAMKQTKLLACGAYGNLPQYFYYHNGSGTYPVQGNKVYSDSAGNNPLANGYYAFYFGTATAVSMQVTTGGVLVQNPTTC